MPEHAEQSTAAPEHPKPSNAGVCAVRVRYAECDPMGVAHHASFVPWLEMARTELLRGSGTTYGRMEADGVFLVVTRVNVRYIRPVRYDDLLEIDTRVEHATRTRLEHAYRVRVVERMGEPVAPADYARLGLADDGLAADATTQLACVDRDGRVAALPDWLLELGG